MNNRTLQQIIADGLSQAAIDEHGRTLTQYTITVTTEPIDVNVPGHLVVLTVAPTGFDYKAERFGIDNNTLLTAAELDARKQYLINEAKAARDAAAAAANGGGA